MLYDAAVVGLGGMGAAAVAHLARRGARVVGIDRHPRGHALGASSGESRIIRKAYFENPAYVPLLERAYDLWRDLEAQTGQSLIDYVGMLMAGEPQREGIAGTLLSARQYGLPLEVYEAADIRRRFPGTTPRQGEIGLLERQAGIVFPEKALAAHLEVAAARGAELRFETPVAAWDASGEIARLTLASGVTIEAKRLAFAPGMWAPELLAGLGLPLRIQRNVQIWFAPAVRHFELGAFPAFFLERSDLPAPLYGFPAIAGALKAALHACGDDVANPANLDRDVRVADVSRVRDALAGWMPGAAARYLRGKVCTYTLSPDGHFILGEHAGIVIACGFSGHGYKFAPVIGEIVADLVLQSATRHDVAFLHPSRFAL
jgi:sarcosine oxidase